MRRFVGCLAWVVVAAGMIGPAACVSDSNATGGDAGGDATSCPSPEILCGTTCVDTSRDPLNCGGCNAACDGGTVCNAGTCAASCPSPEIACSGSCVDTSRDSQNCGTCGKACGAHMQCANSACAPVLCSANADCDDGIECNGVEMRSDLVEREQVWLRGRLPRSRRRWSRRR